MVIPPSVSLSHSLLQGHKSEWTRTCPHYLLHPVAALKTIKTYSNSEVLERDINRPIVTSYLEPSIIEINTEGRRTLGNVRKDSCVIISRAFIESLAVSGHEWSLVIPQRPEESRQNHC